MGSFEQTHINAIVSPVTWRYDDKLGSMFTTALFAPRVPGIFSSSFNQPKKQGSNTEIKIPDLNSQLIEFGHEEY